MDSNEEKFEKLRVFALNIINNDFAHTVLLSNTNSAKKITFFEETLIKNGVLKAIENENPLKNPKNNPNSLKFRIEGNECFAKKDFFNSLKLYNKSICFAANNSENISIGYANRSAILFQLGLYQQCLDNIGMAKTGDLPIKISYKLEKRENDCRNVMEEKLNNSSVKSLKLSYKSNPNVPFLIDSLEVKNTPNMGRGIFTNKDLKPGDLIDIERIFSWTIMENAKYSRCANCLNENFLTLIPCPKCTSAMFCSPQCLEEASNSFHQYECSIIDFLYEYLPSNFNLAIRTSLNVLLEYETIKDCYEDNNEIRKPYNRKMNAKEFDFKMLTQRNGCKLVNNLYFDSTDEGSVHPYLPIIAVIKNFLLTKTSLGDKVTDEIYKDFLSEILLLHSLIVQDNSYGSKILYGQSDSGADFQFLYNFASLYNHSCNPNIDYWFKGKEVYLMVLHPIKKGMQLFVNYGPDFSTAPKLERTSLLECRNITCCCEGCKNDYPLFNTELARSYQSNIYGKEFSGILKREDSIPEFNQHELLKECSRFLQKYYSKFHPDQQIIMVEKMMVKLLSKMVGDTSMRTLIKKILSSEKGR